MQVRRLRPRALERRGFTLIELLVVISIIATLAAMILPAIQQAREAGRQTTCINNQKNIATAIMNFGTTNREQLPLLRDPNSPLDTAAAGASAAVNIAMPWTVAILPQMDARSLYDRLLAYNSATGAAPNDFATLSRTIVQGYTCPDDPAHQTNSALSYVANAGYFDQAYFGAGSQTAVHPYLDDLDWDDGSSGSGAESANYWNVSQAAGVFIDQRWTDSGNMNAVTNTGRRITLSSMYDSKTSTILFSENLQAQNWASVMLGDMAFGVGLAQTSGTPTNLGGTSAAPGTELFLESPNNPPDLTAGERLNGNLAAAEGQSPRPSSLHPGGVLITFCDGRTQFVNDNINGAVYMFAITSSGDRYGQNGAANPLQ